MRVHSHIPSQSMQRKNPFAGAWETLKARLRNVTQPQARTLRHVETLQLGPKRTLHLVECEGQRFLAAGGSDGIHALLPLKGETFVHTGGDADQ